MTTEERTLPENYFQDWKQREELAEAMIPLVGKLYRENNVKTYIYGQNLVNQSVLDIMKSHREVRETAGNELSEFESFPVIKALANLDLGIAHIDAGRIAAAYMADNPDADYTTKDKTALDALYADIAIYVKSQVSDLINDGTQKASEPVDVVLYGFGRIGRLMARLLIEKVGGGEGMRLRAIVIRKGKAADDLATRISLLERDSIHGRFDGTIRPAKDQSGFYANGNFVRFIYANSPEEVDYTEFGIKDAIVIDNTGVWKDRDGLSQHLNCPGAAKVILTAPAKGDIKNIVHGVNDDQILDSDTIISAASCTTNAIVPPLKVLNDEYGIVSGHVETIHAYTNDQNLTDNYHKAARRGRSAPLNMVITETGAAKAVAKVLPELLGKLSGNAIRVPTPNVSLAILKLTLEKEVTKESVNAFMRDVALNSGLRKQVDYSVSPEVVSSDFVGTRSACIIDSVATIANGNSLVMYCWYDNEFGYSCQVHRIVEQMAGVDYAVYPQTPKTA